MFSPNAATADVREAASRVQARIDETAIAVVIDVGEPLGRLRLWRVCMAAFAHALAAELREQGIDARVEARVRDHSEHRELLGRSLKVRYTQEFGSCFFLPPNIIKDGYLVHLGRELKNRVGQSMLTARTSAPFADFAIKYLIETWREDLDAIGVSVDFRFDSEAGEESARARLDALRQENRIAVCPHRHVDPPAISAGKASRSLPVLVSGWDFEGREYNLEHPRGDTLTLDRLREALSRDELRSQCIERVTLG